MRELRAIFRLKRGTTFLLRVILNDIESEFNVCRSSKVASSSSEGWSARCRCTDSFCKMMHLWAPVECRVGSGSLWSVIMLCKVLRDSLQVIFLPKRLQYWLKTVTASAAFPLSDCGILWRECSITSKQPQLNDMLCLKRTPGRQWRKFRIDF